MCGDVGVNDGMDNPALCWLIGGEVVLSEAFKDDSNELLASP